MRWQKNTILISVPEGNLRDGGKRGEGEVKHKSLVWLEES